MSLAAPMHVWLVDPEGSMRAVERVEALLRSAPYMHCVVLYFAPTLASIGQLEAWCALKNLNLARLQLHFTIRDEPQELPISAGALEPAKLSELMAAFCADPSAVSVHVAMSEASTASARDALLAQGIETLPSGPEFSPALDSAAVGAAPVAPVQGVCQVIAMLDGRARHFGIEEGETVLEAGERAGLTLPFSCRSAVCATCRTRVISGSVQMDQNYALEEWEVEAGFILACQARPTSPQLSITYDER